MNPTIWQRIWFVITWPFVVALLILAAVLFCIYPELGDSIDEPPPGDGGPGPMGVM